MFPVMLLITITLKLMFVPLAVGKANMVCLIVASSIPCWLVALSLNREPLPVETTPRPPPSHQRYNCPPAVTESDWEFLGAFLHSHQCWTPLCQCPLSWASDTEPVGHSQDSRPIVGDVHLTHGRIFPTKEIYQLLCCGQCIGCPGGVAPPEGMESVLRRVRKLEKSSNLVRHLEHRVLVHVLGCQHLSLQITQ